MQRDKILEIPKLFNSHFFAQEKGRKHWIRVCSRCLSCRDCHCHVLPYQTFDTQIFFFVLWISGVSAQSFIHAFTLTHSVFNVQIATPQVRKIFNYRGHNFHFIRLFYLTSTPPPLFTEVLWILHPPPLRFARPSIGVREAGEPRGGI